MFDEIKLGAIEKDLQYFLIHLTAVMINDQFLNQPMCCFNYNSYKDILKVVIEFSFILPTSIQGPRSTQGRCVPCEIIIKDLISFYCSLNSCH